MTQEIDSYVVLSPGGSYHDYAQLAGSVKSNEYAVIRYKVWLGWYNKARFSNSRKAILLAVPAPFFTSVDYQEAQNKCNELNAKISV